MGCATQMTVKAHWLLVLFVTLLPYWLSHYMNLPKQAVVHLYYQTRPTFLYDFSVLSEPCTILTDDKFNWSEVSFTLYFTLTISMKCFKGFYIHNDFIVVVVVVVGFHFWSCLRFPFLNEKKEFSRIYNHRHKHFFALHVLSSLS